MNLDALFHNLLTSGIDIPDPETLRKFKVINLFQIVFVMAAPFLGLLFFYIGAVQLFYVVIAAGLLMVCSLAILRHTKNLVLGSHLAIFVLWATLLLVSWQTGVISFEGVIKPSFVLNAALILLAIFLLGYAGGTVWTTVVFLETGLIVYLFRTGYLFPDLIPLEIAPVYYLGTYLVALLALLLFAFLFENEKSDALAREQVKSEALRASKKYIDEILEKSPVPTFILDRSHRVVHWNLACASLTEVPAEAVLGKRVWEGFRVDERGSIADILLEDPYCVSEEFKDAVLYGSETGGFELSLFLPALKGGVHSVVTAAPIMDNNGMVRGAIQTVQEAGTTKGVKGSRELGGISWETESVAYPLFRIDSQGRITYWNQASEKEFGYAPSQMIGKSAFSLVAKNYRPLFRETIIGVLKGETFSNRNFKYYSQEGKPVYVLTKAFPCHGAEGDGRECALIHTNVTELRLRIKKLELYAAEGNEKLKSLAEEHELLKRNIASFIRKKDEKQ